MLKLLSLFTLAAFAAQLCAADAPRAVSAAEFLGGSADSQRVEMEATVSDALSDETDPKFVFLVLDADGETIYAPVRCGNDNMSSVEQLVGARIRAAGVCDPYVPEPRRQLGRQFFIAGLDDIEVLRPAPSDPFDVPELGDTKRMTPAEISRLDDRRIAGRILASWSDTESLLKTPSGRLMRVSFASRPAPKGGTFAEVVGRPVSDVYRVNLERARWRPSDPFDFAETSATNVTARDIMLGENGQVQVKPQFLGKTIVLRGTLRNRNGDTLNIEDGSFLVSVVAPEANPDIEPGSVVEATGICVLDVENWRPNAAFPQIRGFFVVCGADGLRVIARPPWWTSGRLFTVIAILLAAVAAVLVWNRSLKALAERRGRALLRAQLGQIKSTLKISERTRLAAELHDTLAQNLTGVSMEISAAQRLLPASAPSAAIQHLEFASNAIASSRDELRNCLWDLRGEALDQPDMEKAVEFSIRPHVGDTSVAIRFRVPRARLSDALAHATLRIVRELTINAIRHGGAKTIRIAGCIDGYLLKFSVSDDGRGFDPKSAPSIDQGHFGLQGIRERVDTFGGSISIDSSPGRGTRVDVTVAIHGEEEDKPE
jgi:signal transduction histidine kinase